MRAARLARQSKASGLATKSISEKKYAHHLSFEIEHGHGKSTTAVPPDDSEGMQHRGGDHSKDGVAKIIAHKKAVEGNGSAGIMSSEVRRKRQDSKIFRELKASGDLAAPPKRTEPRGTEQLLYFQEEIAREEAAKPREVRSTLRSEASEIMYGKDGEGAQFSDIAKRRPKLFEGAGGASSKFLIRTDIMTPLYRFDGNVEALGDESGQEPSLDLRALSRRLVYSDFYQNCCIHGLALLVVR